MGQKEKKVMISNMDVILLSDYFSQVYNCSRADALQLIKKAIQSVTFDNYNDYDTVFSLCEQPVPAKLAVK